MEQYFKDLITACKDGDYARAEEKDFNSNGKKVRVFKIECDDAVLYYWNSANFQEIRHTTFLNNLIDDLLEEQGDGTNYDGWNEIMYELF